LRLQQGLDAVAWELLIVDNNSSDGTEECVLEANRTLKLPVRYLKEPTQGLSSARNHGIREAQGDIVAFTDDDQTVGTQWLRAILDAYDRYDCVGVGGQIIEVLPEAQPPWLTTDGPYSLAWVLGRFQPSPQPKKLNTAPYGGNMAVRRNAFARYGLFRSDLGRNNTTPLTGEEADYFGRLLANGETIMYVPDAVIFHHIEKGRLSKRYFLSWHYHHGRSLARMRTLQCNPSSILRKSFSFGIRWLLSTNQVRRFYYKAQVAYCFGTLCELLRLRVYGTPALVPEPKTP
jgi:GT2 family glycosyltransferase